MKVYFFSFFKFKTLCLEKKGALCMYDKTFLSNGVHKHKIYFYFLQMFSGPIYHYLKGKKTTF